MGAAFHHAADVKIVGVEEAGDGDAKEVFGAELLGEDALEKFGAGGIWDLGFGIWDLVDGRQFGFVGSAVAAAAGLAAEILQNQVARLGAGEADAVGQEVEVGVGIDESRDGCRSAIMSIGKRDLMTIGVRTRQREEVVFAKQSARLLCDAANDVGKRDSPFQGLRQHMAARIGRRLKADAGDPRASQAEFDERAELIVIDPGLQRGDERDVDARAAEGFERGELNFQKRLAAKGVIDIVVQAIKLKIDLHPVAVAGYQFDEHRVAREPDAVGIDHDVVDIARQGVFDNLGNLRMSRRLAARKLADFGPAFYLDQAIDLALAVGERQMFSTGAAGGITHRTSQIAGRGDFQHSNARMLFVLGAQATVQRTALLRLDADDRRHAGRQGKLHPVVPFLVRANEIFALAVLITDFAKVDASAAGDDLGWDY